MGAVKARDIIAGWPKGRSTGCFTRYEDPNFEIRVGRRKWGWEEILCLLIEISYEQTYRRHQQRMIDRFRAEFKGKPIVDCLTPGDK